jgi:glycosyltransferase involved in cell wall biosynthesis
VPHGDVDAIATRLGLVLEDPALRDRLGRQAREFAEAYSWDAAADRTEAHLRAVLRGDVSLQPPREER